MSEILIVNTKIIGTLISKENYRVVTKIDVGDIFPWGAQNEHGLMFRGTPDQKKEDFCFSYNDETQVLVLPNKDDFLNNKIEVNYFAKGNLFYAEMRIFFNNQYLVYKFKGFKSRYLIIGNFVEKVEMIKEKIYLLLLLINNKNTFYHVKRTFVLQEDKNNIDYALFKISKLCKISCSVKGDSLGRMRYSSYMSYFFCSNLTNIIFSQYSYSSNLLYEKIQNHYIIQ